MTPPKRSRPRAVSERRRKLARRCEHCGAGAPGATPRPADIIHKPGCPVGRERQQRAAIAEIKRAVRKQRSIERQSEKELKKVRASRDEAIAKAAAAGVPKTELAVIADVNRSRIYQVLDDQPA